MAKNELQKAIDHLGYDATVRYLPRGMRIDNCDVHGGFLTHYKAKEALCPLCIKQDPAANGTTATEVEHFINIRDVLAPGQNPHM
jgi:hypothetical protein